MFLKCNIRTLTSNLERLVPDKAVHAQLRCEDEFDEVPLSLLVRKCEGVHTETLHHTIRTGNGSVGHGPEEHVCGLGVEILEVPEVVVGTLSLMRDQ
jgi:hypothetical protein